MRLAHRSEVPQAVSRALQHLEGEGSIQEILEYFRKHLNMYSPHKWVKAIFTIQKEEDDDEEEDHSPLASHIPNLVSGVAKDSSSAWIPNKKFNGQSPLWLKGSFMNTSSSETSNFYAPSRLTLQESLECSRGIFSIKKEMDSGFSRFLRRELSQGRADKDPGDVNDHYHVQNSQAGGYAEQDMKPAFLLGWETDYFVDDMPQLVPPKEFAAAADKEEVWGPIDHFGDLNKKEEIQVWENNRTVSAKVVCVKRRSGSIPEYLIYMRIYDGVERTTTSPADVLAKCD